MDATGDPTDKGLDLAGADGRVNAMLGVDDDGSPVLKMADEDGTVRLRLRVTVEDEAAPELVETGDERGGIRKGIASRFFRAKAVVLAAVLAFTMLFASGALAANGKPFILGKKNVATKISTLIKKGAGPALDLRVDSGSPLAVNSDEQVANLNADKVDGLDAGDFLAANGTAANSQQLEGQPASAFMQNGSSAGGSLAGTYPNPGIAAGAVGANQIASGAVNGSKIANSSVGTGQIDNTQVQQRVSDSCPSGSSIQSISQAGTVVCESDGVTGREIVQNSGPFNNDASKSAGADCPSGKIAISGGGRYSSSENGNGTATAHEIAFRESYPVGVTRWTVAADDMDTSGIQSSFNWRLIVYVVCVNQ